ncbi:hypothetical protein J3F84DRAFT_46724 [Trichoderma pleuroticola]
MDNGYHYSAQPGQNSYSAQPGEHGYPTQQDEASMYFSAQSDNSGYVAGSFSQDPNQRLHLDAPQPSSGYSQIPLDPRNVAPLGLSGRILSVTFTIPYALRAPRNQDQEWEVKLRSRIEHSVQFDILSYLSLSESPPEHMIIGWTGEISGFDATHSQPNDSSPWFSNVPNPLPQPRHNAFVSFDSQRVLEQQLANAELATVPIWMETSRDSVRNRTDLGDQAR